MGAFLERYLEQAGKEMREDFLEWMSESPESLQKLIYKFPPAFPVSINGYPYFVLGYERDRDEELHRLLVSPIDPSVDYEAADDMCLAINPLHLLPAAEAN